MKKLIHEFEYDINASDFQTIASNVTGRVEFIKDDVTRVGWIEEMNYNNWTGRASVKLISEEFTV